MWGGEGLVEVGGDDWGGDGSWKKRKVKKFQNRFFVNLLTSHKVIWYNTSMIVMAKTDNP